jgi:hypothetical protein
MQMAVNGGPLETIRELLSKHSSNKTLLGDREKQVALPERAVPFSVDEEVFDMHKAPTAACVDMKAFFNQFELPTYLRDCLFFRTKMGERRRPHGNHR